MRGSAKRRYPLRLTYMPSNRSGTGRVIQPGTRFGKLVFVCEIDPVRRNGKIERRALFTCDCGRSYEATPRQVWRGVAKSCGCLQHRTTHGMSKTSFYASWCDMKTRSAREDGTYAGVGMDPRWNTFETFKDDMLATWFPGAVLGRYGDEGDYRPDNCRWITRAENNREAAEARKASR